METREALKAVGAKRLIWEAMGRWKGVVRLCLTAGLLALAWPDVTYIVWLILVLAVVGLELTSIHNGIQDRCIEELARTVEMEHAHIRRLQSDLEELRRG